jgi:hypothetical protein
VPFPAGRGANCGFPAESGITTMCSFAVSYSPDGRNAGVIGGIQEFIDP